MQEEHMNGLQRMDRRQEARTRPDSRRSRRLPVARQTEMGGIGNGVVDRNALWTSEVECGGNATAGEGVNAGDCWYFRRGVMPLAGAMG